MLRARGFPILQALPAIARFKPLPCIFGHSLGTMNTGFSVRVSVPLRSERSFGHDFDATSHDACPGSYYPLRKSRQTFCLTTFLRVTQNPRF